MKDNLTIRILLLVKCLQHVDSLLRPVTGNTLSNGKEINVHRGTESVSVTTAAAKQFLKSVSLGLKSGRSSSTPVMLSL